MKNFGGIKIIMIAALALLILAGTCAAVSLSNSGGGTWKYQREISIKENSGTALTDYQVLIELKGADFPGEAKSDGADVRFADSNGNELNYWIESWDYAGKNAKIWVKIPWLTASAITNIQMYYGNPNAGVLSKGEKVFDLFDDFSTKDNNKWSLSWDWIIENEQAKLTPMYGPGNEWGVLVAPLNLSISSTGYSVKYRIINSPGIWNWDTYNSFLINGIEYGTDILQDYNACNYFFHLNGPDCGINEGLFLDTRNWHTYEFVILSNSQKLYVDNSPFHPDRWKSYNLNNQKITKLHFSIKGGGYIDDFRIRKYASSEPTITLAPLISSSLTITKSASPYSLRQFQESTIKVLIENSGTSEVKGIEIMDSIHPSFDLTGGDFPNPKKFDSIRAGESRELQYTIKSKESGGLHA
jgi:hypothetical protein